MYLYCNKYMQGTSEVDIQSVFDHWCNRNQDCNQETTSYANVRSNMRERGIIIRRITSEMDWGYFKPLSREECLWAPKAPARESGEPEYGEDE
jgi:hypothetical protein